MMMQNRGVRLGRPFPYYTTTFAATENPISEGGIYDGGATVGLDWLDIKTTGGIACASAFSKVTGHFNDCWAILKPSFLRFSDNQSIRSVLSVAGGYSPADPVFHEHEHLLCATPGAHSITCIECSWSLTEAALNVVRWNGALDDFSAPLNSFPISGGIQDGDEVWDEKVGLVITHRIIRAGVTTVLGTTTLGSPISGQPGLGAWCREGGTFASYGATSTVFSGA